MNFVRKKSAYLLFLLVQLSFGQVEVELFFYDSCKDSIIKSNFEIISLEFDKTYISNNSLVTIPSNKIYMVDVGVERIKDESSNYSKFIYVNSEEKMTDTIFTPRILFTTGIALHSSNWNYFNCNKICDGLETDYHKNGNKRTEGVYKNRKPYYISEYNEDGFIETKTYYDFGKLEIRKVEYYDQLGNLKTYEVYKKRNRKTVIKKYNSDNKLISREVEY